MYAYVCECGLVCKTESLEMFMKLSQLILITSNKMRRKQCNRRQNEKRTSVAYFFFGQTPCIGITTSSTCHLLDYFQNLAITSKIDWISYKKCLLCASLNSWAFNKGGIKKKINSVLISRFPLFFFSDAQTHTRITIQTCLATKNKVYSKWENNVLTKLLKNYRCFVLVYELVDIDS